MFHIGIDLGGTNIAVGVVDDQNHIVGKGRLKTMQGYSADEIMQDMAEASKMAVADAGLKISDISDVGIAAPGNINPETEYILYSNNIHVKNYNAVSSIKRLLGIDRCYIANDANAAAYGELLAGAGKGCSNFIAVTLGTGIGAGIIVDGKIYTGSNHVGAEPGHSMIIVDGERCTCGNRGCWEAYASATALLRQTREAMQKFSSSIMWEIAGSLEGVTGRTAFDAMRKGDEAARTVVENYIYYVSCGILNLVNIFQPEFICIGGGICNEGETLLSPIREYINEHDFNRNADTRVKLCRTELGNDAGIIGAANLYKLA